MIDLKLGISTCPNDTYIFGAMLNGYIEHTFNIYKFMDDVQCLNKLAMNAELEVVKVSFGVYPKIASDYKILKAGGAMGFGCGPLLLSKKYSSTDALKGKKIAIPGLNTTAFMILKRFFPECAQNIVELRFDKIMPAIVAGEVDGGLVIHEGRFVFEEFGLCKIVDLGNVWEDKLNCPIPLGFIAIRKDMAVYADQINDSIRRSIEFAGKNQEKIYEFVKTYACDMDKTVMKSHVKLYVNEYSLDLTKAKKSVFALLDVDENVFV